MNIAEWIYNRLSSAFHKPYGRADGRLIVVAMLCAYFVLLFAGSQILRRPYYRVWHYFGVPAVSFSESGLTTHSFADLRSVLSCYDCTRLGYDVMVDNPCNPNQTGKGATPYPRIWWTLTPLGLSQRHTMPLGLCITGVFYAAILLFVGKLNTGEGMFYGLLLCSPPLMLLVERCNVDNVIFLTLLVALCICAWGRSVPARVCGYGLIFLAGVFKLYPMAGVILLLKEKGRTRLFLAAVFMALALVYYVSHSTEMRLLRAVAGDTEMWSYGYKVIFFRLSQLFIGNGSYGTSRILKILFGSLLGLTFISAMFVLARLCLAAFRGWLQHPYTVQPATDITDARTALRLDSFRLGASLYVLTFALGSVFTYKLVFVMFALPQLLAWIKQGEKWGRITSLALAGILVMFYLVNFFVVGFDKIISWLLLGYFACGLVVTLPGELKNWVHQLLTRKPVA